MKPNKHCTIVAALFCAALTASAWDASENQIWLDGSVQGKIADQIQLKLTEQVRYKDEGRLYYYRYSDIEVGYAFAKNWCIVPAFRYIASANSKGVWSNTEMVHLNLNNNLPMLGMDLKTRLRFTYSEQEDRQADFRPEFTLLPGKGFTDWKLKPYLADEIMYNLNEEHLYRNRFSVGLQLSPINPLSLKLFVMQEIAEKTEDSDFKENFNYGLYAGYKF